MVTIKWFETMTMEAFFFLLFLFPSHQKPPVRHQDQVLYYFPGKVIFGNLIEVKGVEWIYEQPIFVWNSNGGRLLVLIILFT